MSQVSEIQFTKSEVTEMGNSLQQGPDNTDCSVISAMKRISFGAQVIQTLTAEKMNEHGFGRQTFQVELDSENLPVCHVFKSKLTLEEAYSKTGLVCLRACLSLI